MKSYLVKKEEVKRKWCLIDAKDKILGKVAVEAATILRGKHKPEFTPHVDCGDGVIIINTAHIRVTGNKLKAKLYDSYSGYPGGLKQRTLENVLAQDPTFVMTEAVRGMLPKGSLGRKMIKKLKVYKEDKHENQAQKPTEHKI